MFPERCSFDGIKLKVARAKVQFKALDKLTRKFHASDPYEVIHQHNVETGRIWATFHVRKQIPPRWSVLVGELIHNLRSCLDHLVWQLVILETGQPPTVTKTQFPIFLDVGGWNNQRNAEKLIRGVGDDAKALIKVLQPFSTGEREASPLWHLNQLSNWDKHRTIQLMMAAKTGSEIRANANEFESVFSASSGPIKDGAVVFGANLRPNGVPFHERLKPNTKMDVQTKLTIDVAFDSTSALNGAIVITALRAIGSRVLKVVNTVHEEIFEKATP